MADKEIEKDAKEDAIISYGMATGNHTWQEKKLELKENMHIHEEDDKDAVM